ncbi:unnamed protein product [Sphagnum balticum]
MIFTKTRYSSSSLHHSSSSSFSVRDWWWWSSIFLALDGDDDDPVFFFFFFFGVGATYGGFSIMGICNQSSSSSIYSDESSTSSKQ